MDVRVVAAKHDLNDKDRWDFFLIAAATFDGSTEFNKELENLRSKNQTSPVFAALTEYFGCYISEMAEKQQVATS